MEVYQKILIVIGAITVIWLIYRAIKGIFYVLGVGMAGAFRDKFPYDFKINLEWVISELKFRGYVEAAMMDAGGDYPGVIMKHPQTGNEIEVRLQAPLFTSKGYSIIVANHDDNTAIVMQDSGSDVNKKLLLKYLE